MGTLTVIVYCNFFPMNVVDMDLKIYIYNKLLNTNIILNSNLKEAVEKL